MKWNLQKIFGLAELALSVLSVKVILSLSVDLSGSGKVGHLQKIIRK